MEASNDGSDWSISLDMEESGTRPHRLKGTIGDHTLGYKVLCLTLFCAYYLDFYLVASSPGSPMFNLHS